MMVLRMITIDQVRMRINCKRARISFMIMIMMTMTLMNRDECRL